MDDVLLGIDLGTGSSKGVLVSPDGRTRATATVPHQVQMPRPGWFEVDADAIWWADVVALCRELLPQADGSRVAGVCVSGVGPCLLLADADGTPLRPAMLYGIDMRATARDRRADAEVRSRGHPASLWQGSLDPGGRAQAALVASPRAGGLGTHPQVVRRQLVRRPPADG